MSEFKRIFFWEYAHRLLGRLIGLTFLLPIPILLLRRHLPSSSLPTLLGIGALIGAQGFMGWYMVQSGLDAASIKDLGGVARVSQYRLAAHLALAFIVYASCLRLGFGIARDWKLVRRGLGLAGVQGVGETLRRLQLPVVNKMRVATTAVTALVFLTALSGSSLVPFC